MTTVRYCTPEWFEHSAKIYQVTPRFKQEFAKLTVKLAFIIRADPAWGIERDILFCTYVDKGELVRIAFLSEADARLEADFILAATPQEWKRLLRKDTRFVTEFLLGKISLAQGSKVGVLNIAPHANTFIEALTQVELQFPDEMTPEELEEYRDYQRKFRLELNV